MVSVAVACLPAAVSLLLLAALFMQISGVSLALTWPCRLCLLRVLLCVSLCCKLSLFQALGKVTLHPHFQACVFIYSSRGKWVFPLSCGVFLPPPLLQAFLLLVAGWVLLLLPSLAHLFIYSSRRDFPSPRLWCSGCPTLLVMCLCCCYCLLFSFFFLFSLGAGRSVQGAVLIWPSVVYGNTMCHLAHLVFCIFPSGMGAAVWRQHESPPGFSV
jgi:hypothetical protein